MRTGIRLFVVSLVTVLFCTLGAQSISYATTPSDAYVPASERVSLVATEHQKSKGRCAIAVAASIAPLGRGYKLYKFVRAAGGVRKAANLLVGAGGRAAEIKMIGHVAGPGLEAFLGITQIAENC